MTIRYTTTSITFGGKTLTKLSDSLHRILSEQRPEKNLSEKNPIGKKTVLQEIWVGSMAHALKSPSYQGNTAGRSLPLFTKQKIRINYTKRKQAKTSSSAKLELSPINQIYTK